MVTIKSLVCIEAFHFSFFLWSIFQLSPLLLALFFFIEANMHAHSPLLTQIENNNDSFLKLILNAVSKLNGWNGWAYEKSPAIICKRHHILPRMQLVRRDFDKNEAQETHLAEHRTWYSCARNQTVWIFSNILCIRASTKRFEYASNKVERWKCESAYHVWQAITNWLQVLL